MPACLLCAAALLEGQEGFDFSRGTWRRSGWKELDNLRRVRATKAVQQAGAHVKATAAEPFS